MYTKILAAYSNDYENRVKSSSGGVFSEIAKYVISNNGYVFGATMKREEGQFICMHKECTEIEELDELRGSKYAPSELKDSYKRIKTLLDEKKLVLFSGTPCQVAGLLSFLGKQYENLITIDFICHGVPSQILINKIIKEIEDNTQKKVKKVDFRDKVTGWDNYSFTIKFEDGSVNSIIGLKSDFMKLFLSDMYLRESCYNCQYKGIYRESDITLGDFWGVQDYLQLSTEEIEKGVSVVIIHSENANKIFEIMGDKLTTEILNETVFDTSNIYVKKCAIRPLNKKIYEKILFTNKSSEVIEKYNKQKKIYKFQNKVLGKLEKIVKRKKIEFKGLPNKKHCYGCLACEKICPFDAIKIEKDKLNFSYPLIDLDKCKKCKKCELVCPQRNISYYKR